jgi:hypothetical protein
VFGKVGAWVPTALSPDGVVSLLVAHATLAVGILIAILLAPVAAYVVTRDEQAEVRQGQVVRVETPSGEKF